MFRIDDLAGAENPHWQFRKSCTAEGGIFGADVLNIKPPSMASVGNEHEHSNKKEEQGRQIFKTNFLIIITLRIVEGGCSLPYYLFSLSKNNILLPPFIT